MPTPRLSEHRDSRTGYRSMVFDVVVPDRRPDEPYEIRVRADEWATKRWNCSIVLGPYAEPVDAAGSLYRQDTFVRGGEAFWSMEGSPSSVKPHLLRHLRAAYDRIEARRDAAEFVRWAQEGD